MQPCVLVKRLKEKKYEERRKIKYFSSNDKGNKILQPGQTYRFSDLRGHSHNPGMREDGYPKDYTVLHGTDLGGH